MSAVIFFSLLPNGCNFCAYVWETAFVELNATCRLQTVIGF